MFAYKYKAINQEGRTVQGRMEANNPSDLEAQLSNARLDLITWKELRAGASVSRGRIRRQDLITFSFQLEQLLRSGVPLMEGLSDLRDTVDHPRMRQVLGGLVESIEGGRTLSEAMGRYPAVFDNVFISVIKAGEQSGRLDAVLRSLTENLKWQDELASQAKKIMLYPAIVGIVVTAVVMFLMMYVVPQLVQFIKSMGQDIPLHTRALIFVSGVLTQYWYLVIALPVVLPVALRLAAARSAAVHYRLDAFKLRMWLVGPILRKIILTRFANYFALMYASGISVLGCIKISEEIVGNRVISLALGRVGQQVSDGLSISASMANAKLFPPLVLRMLKVGESTGALDTALLNVSYFYNREVQESISRVQTLIGPVMTVVLGLIVLWVAMAVLGPIYDIITKIKT